MNTPMSKHSQSQREIERESLKENKTVKVKEKLKKMMEASKKWGK